MRPNRVLERAVGQVRAGEVVETIALLRDLIGRCLG